MGAGSARKDGKATMTDDLTAAPARRPATSSGPRIIGLIAAAAGVLVLAAAAFVLSYRGVHAVARQAGVAASLARIYPAAIDALIVVAGAAVLSLRGAGIAARCYAWLSLLVLLAAAAGADSLHAAGTHIPHRASEIAAAIIPWVLLLVGFSLLLVMLRHGRPRGAAATAAARPANPAAVTSASAGLAMTSTPGAAWPDTPPPAGQASAEVTMAGPAGRRRPGATLADSGEEAIPQVGIPAPASLPPASPVPEALDPSGTGPAVPLPASTPAVTAQLTSGAGSVPPPAGQAPAGERPWVPWTTYPAPSGQGSADGGPAGQQDPAGGGAELQAEPLLLPQPPGPDAAEPKEAETDEYEEQAADGGGPDTSVLPSFDRLRSGPTPPGD